MSMFPNVSSVLAYCEPDTLAGLFYDMVQYRDADPGFLRDLVEVFADHFCQVADNNDWRQFAAHLAVLSRQRKRAGAARMVALQRDRLEAAIDYHYAESEKIFGQILSAKE